MVKYRILLIRLLTKFRRNGLLFIVIVKITNNYIKIQTHVKVAVMELEGMDCNCAMSGANRALLSSSKGSDGNPEARNKKK